MTEALRTLLAGLIDYAGLFPPAGLDMPDAARNYAAYRAGPHAWALGRFIVPAARLGEVDPAWSFSVISVPSQWVEACEIKVEHAADAAAILAALAQYESLPEKPRKKGPQAGLAGETACPTNESTALAAVAVPPARLDYFSPSDGRGSDRSVSYFELPILEDPAPLAGKGRAKVRTGGLTPDAFPTAVDLARWISRCATARVPFKATAGLHHPLRSVQRCTYQPDSPTALMHGFVNVFLASALLWHGGSEAAAIATLEEQSPGAFHFDDRSAAWHTHSLNMEHLREARERFAISFGSCSFEEPIHDLQQLGWL